MVDIIGSEFQHETNDKYKYSDVFSLVIFKKKCFEAIVNHSLITDNLKDDIRTIMDSTVIEGYDVCGIQRLIQEAIGNQVLLPINCFRILMVVLLEA